MNAQWHGDSWTSAPPPPMTAESVHEDYLDKLHEARGGGHESMFPSKGRNFTPGLETPFYALSEGRESPPSHKYPRLSHFLAALSQNTPLMLQS